MAKSSKFIKLNPNILMEWIFDSEYYVSENYKVVTNLNENKKRIFLSTSNINNINNNLFQLDPVLKKYTLINSAKYNFLQEQDYNSAAVQYDTVKIYLPTSFNFTFNGYVGLYLKIFAYGFYNKTIFELSNIFFDVTSFTNSGLTQLTTPFIYDMQEWGKYYQFEIPSIDFLSNQRSGSTVDNFNNIHLAIPNSINYNLTLGEGLSQTGPIFVDFQFLNSKETILGTNYYYASETFRTSFSKSADYNTLGVKIQESSEGDFFEIIGMYGESNENLDNFVDEMYNKGRSIRIEYDVYLYEENIQTNLQTIAVTKDFSQKIFYRPVLTFSNTTASIKVEMKVIDLVNMSTISRFATLGLSDNIQKYGKRLISLNVSNLNKLKIYNAKPDEIILGKDYFSGNLTTEIIKVNSPQLIEVGKILVNSTSSSNEYKGIGLLNIVITPFDNIIKFILKSVNSLNEIEPYNLSEFLNNSKIQLIFKSDSLSIEKDIYNEVENRYSDGEINFKIVENDLNALKSIYDKGYNSFYLVVTSNELKTKTLLYSGTFTFYNDLVFYDTVNETYMREEANSNSIEYNTPIDNNTSSETTKISGKTVIIYTKYKNTSN